MADLKSEWDTATPVALQDAWEKASPVSLPNKDSMPANAGMVNFAAGVAGLPVDAVTNALNLGIAGVGKLTSTAPPLIQNPIGGSESIKKALRATGVSGLNPDSPTEKPALAYDLASKGAMIPGAALPAIASQVAEKTLGPQWSGVGQLAPSAAITAFNAARAPTLAKQQAQNVTRDTTYKEVSDAGYVFPPSTTNPRFVNKRLESVGGKAAINQESTIRNQQVTNDLARKALDFPENTPLTVDRLNSFRNQAAQPYRDVAALSPAAASALEKLKQARSDANQYYRHNDISGDPASLKQAQALSQKADMLETALERMASKNGKPDLVQELRDARVEIAKSYTVERALNVADGNVDARVIGRALDKGKPLTGPLETIGKFAEAFNPWAREGSRVPTPGVSKSEALASIALALGGHAALGPYGTALAAAPLASGPVRNMVLSPFWQKNMGAPNYTPSLIPQDPTQMLIQQGLLQQR